MRIGVVLSAFLQASCASALPPGRDTAAALQVTLLVAVMMLAVRLHRRRP